MDYTLPGSSVHGTLQSRILEWVAISISRGVFLIQATNLGLLHCRQTLCHLSPQGALFTTAKSRKDTKGPYRRCGTHIHEYMKWNITQPLKKNETMPYAATWTDPEIIILSEITQRDKYHMISLIHGI